MIIVSFPSEVISLQSSFSILTSRSWKLWSPIIFSLQCFSKPVLSQISLTWRDAQSIPYCPFHCWFPFYKFKFYWHSPSKQTFQRNLGPSYIYCCTSHYFCTTFFLPFASSNIFVQFNFCIINCLHAANDLGRLYYWFFSWIFIWSDNKLLLLLLHLVLYVTILFS